MTKYFLSRHVYYCIRDDTVVFLDLKNDEYSMIDGDRALVFQAWSCEQSKGGEGLVIDHAVASGSALADTISELGQNGLITTDSAMGKPLRETVADVPSANLIIANANFGAQVKIHHVFWSFVSCAIAAARLHFSSIESIIRAVEYRKMKSWSACPPNLDKTRQLVLIFNKLRVFFPKDYLCLFDSLALIEFLARYDIFPCFVFAVRRECWDAHCWVQEGSTVFNEDIEEASDYVPIMVI